MQRHFLYFNLLFICILSIEGAAGNLERTKYRMINNLIYLCVGDLSNFPSQMQTSTGELWNWKAYTIHLYKYTFIKFEKDILASYLFPHLKYSKLCRENSRRFFLLNSVLSHTLDWNMPTFQWWNTNTNKKKRSWTGRVSILSFWCSWAFCLAEDHLFLYLIW